MSMRLPILCTAAAALLGGCESVSLDQPAPIAWHALPAAAPSAPAVPAPAAPACSAPAAGEAAASAPAAQAQPLAPPPPIEAQPLAPASSPASAPASASAAAPASAPAPAPAASAASAASAATLFVCDDHSSFSATFDDVGATLSTAIGVVHLEQMVSADGARYRNGELEVWFKGREATIRNLDHAGSSLHCAEQR